MQWQEMKNRKRVRAAVLAGILWLALCTPAAALELLQALDGTAGQYAAPLPAALPAAKPAVREARVRFASPQLPGGGAELLLWVFCECADFNHVGNEWVFGFYLGDTAVETGSEITLLPAESLVIGTWIEEMDKYSDYGAARDTVMLTPEDMQAGFSLSQTIRVVEDAGRYKGSCAVWTVSYYFLPGE